MKLLLDECVPRKIKFLFAAEGMFCETVRDAGWSGKENGELLSLAEKNYDVLVTIDRNIRHQQNLLGLQRLPLRFEGGYRVAPKHLSLHQNRDYSERQIESRGYQ